MKHMVEKGEIFVKKWGFRCKKWVIGVEKLRAGIQNRKAKWCKMQLTFLKLEQNRNV